VVKRLLGGVFIGTHAVVEGYLTRDQLEKGPYLRVLHGVYADPSIPRDHLLRCRAASLIMPPGEVRWSGPRGVRVRRTPVPAHELLATDDGLRFTTAPRTAWDVAVLEPVATAVGVIDAMLRLGLVEKRAMETALRSDGRRWGRRRVKRVVGLLDARSESPPESWVRVACALAGLPPPVPQYEIWEDGVFLARGDLVWPEAKLVVEYEGEYHFADGQIVRDDARIARLVAAGWRVIRIAAHDLRSMDDVVRRIAEALDAPTPAA
jgi:hypothetical protein